MPGENPDMIRPTLFSLLGFYYFSKLLYYVYPVYSIIEEHRFPISSYLKKNTAQYLKSTLRKSFSHRTLKLK